MKRAKVLVGLVLLAVLAWIVFGSKSAAAAEKPKTYPPPNANFGYNDAGQFGFWDYGGKFVPWP